MISLTPSPVTSAAAQLDILAKSRFSSIDSKVPSPRFRSGPDRGSFGWSEGGRFGTCVVPWRLSDRPDRGSFGGAVDKLDVAQVDQRPGAAAGRDVGRGEPAIGSRRLRAAPLPRARPARLGTLSLDSSTAPSRASRSIATAPAASPSPQGGRVSGARRGRFAAAAGVRNWRRPDRGCSQLGWRRRSRRSRTSQSRARSST
jgi:hypothetical protein